MTTPLTSARERLSEIVDEVASTGTHRVITKHGRSVAVLVAFDEYEELVETLNILSDPDTMAALAEAAADIEEGRLREFG